MPWRWSEPDKPTFDLLYQSYPAHRRGGPVPAHRAFGEAIRALREEGEPDPVAFLFERISAYARSWAANKDGGQYAMSLARFFADGCYRQDSADFDDPKVRAERDRATARDVAMWKQDPHNPRWAIAAAKLAPEQAAKRRAEWERVGGTPGPWGVIHSLRVVG